MINKNKMKLLIAVPSLDYIHYKFVQSLTNLVRRLNQDGIDNEVHFENGTIIYLERDNLVRYAANNNFTHILWLDADMVFADDIVNKFIASGKDFICGLYLSRHEGRRSCVFDDLKRSHRIYDYPDEIFPIEGCGFACVWTKATIPINIMNHEGTCFMPNPRYGEDLAFCEKVLQYNYQMYCHPGIPIGHIGYEEIWPENSRPEQANV